MTEEPDEAAALYGEGRYAEAEAVLRARLRASPTDSKAQRGLGRLLLLQGKTPDPPDGASAIVQAKALLAALGPPGAQGRDEGVRLHRAAEVLLRFSPMFPETQRVDAAQILWQAGLYAEAEKVGEVAVLGRLAASQGGPLSMLKLAARTSGAAGRREVLAWHRSWASGLAARAAADPLPERRRGEARSRLRLGFLSSDLRAHVVGYFAQPLFQFLDPRFELYVYSSFPGAADPVQHWFASRSTSFRQLPADDRAAAVQIAADDLDMLIEIGGPTTHNRPGVLAFRPAPLQASWLGYPMSLGLDEIDYLICDAQMLGARPAPLIETPLVMPRTSLVMAPAAFQDLPAVAPEPPVMRNGYVTFGTANDPYKFSPDVLRAWARIVAASPGARFMIVRPEAGAACFQQSVIEHFSAQGVGGERIDFHALRGAVRPLYGQMDIALDTFPITGGTTTCEALWMGVPTVTLAGEALYERLSAAILTNAGLSELVASSLADYERIAADWAAAPERLAAFRSGARDRIRSHPLGDPAAFAADVYGEIASVIAKRLHGEGPTQA